MSIVQSSLMGAGVACQSSPGRTHSGTVGALEGGWWWRRCRDLPAVSGRSDLFLPALFDLLEGLVGYRTPANSVLGAAFQLCRSHARVLQVSLDASVL